MVPPQPKGSFPVEVKDVHDSSLPLRDIPLPTLRGTGEAFFTGTDDPNLREILGAQMNRC